MYNLIWRCVTEVPLQQYSLLESHKKKVSLTSVYYNTYSCWKNLALVKVDKFIPLFPKWLFHTSYFSGASEPPTYLHMSVQGYRVTTIRMFPKNGVPQNGWLIMENPMKIAALGVFPYFWFNTHMGNGWVGPWTAQLSQRWDASSRWILATWDVPSCQKD